MTVHHSVFVVSGMVGVSITFPTGSSSHSEKLDGFSCTSQEAQDSNTDFGGPSLSSAA